MKWTQRSVSARKEQNTMRRFENGQPILDSRTIRKKRKEKRRPAPRTLHVRSTDCDDVDHFYMEIWTSVCPSRSYSRRWIIMAWGKQTANKAKKWNTSRGTTTNTTSPGGATRPSLFSWFSSSFPLLLPRCHHKATSRRDSPSGPRYKKRDWDWLPS